MDHGSSTEDPHRSGRQEAGAPGTDTPAPTPEGRLRKLLDECEVTTFRASGPGGQHRNRRESAVRLRHIPTGIVVVATERRSQHQNRAVALERLARRLAERARRRKPRVATKVPRASREKRRETKERQAERKKLRRTPPAD